MSSISLRVVASTSRAARAVSRPCRVQSRALHQRRPLSYPAEEGLGSFLPPHTVKMLSEDYQQGLLDRLNDQVRGTGLENKSIVQTIIESARDPDKVLEFNYASEALNNSFFLENLKPPRADGSSNEAPLLATGLNRASLLRRIQYDYGTLAHFKSSFSAAVLGMFSSGWIWFVADQEGALGIVPTFGSGTLLVRSSKPSAALDEWQRIVGDPVLQYVENVPDVGLGALPDAASVLSPNSTPTPGPSAASPTHPAGATSPLSGVTHGAPGLDPHAHNRSIATMPRPRGMYAAADTSPLNETERDKTKTGETLYPLFCVSVHEHAWMSAGYGVWGKEEYMKRFWSVVDWEKAVRVYENLGLIKNIPS